MFTATLLLALSAPAQPPQNMLAERLAALEGRVSALEARLETRQPPRSPAAPDGLHARHDAYAEARARAIRENLPLVVWSGSAVCPPCVTSTEGEFVNYVGTLPELTPNALTVAVPENGDLWNVGTVTTWVTGDVERGHVPSVRAALQRWRDRREVTRTATAPMMGYQSMQFGGMPMMGYGGGMMSMGAGGCASCGSSGQGFFGRR